MFRILKDQCRRHPILWGFLLTRAAILLIGVATLTHKPLTEDDIPGDYHRPAVAFKALEMWSRWDAEWYMAIAEVGYNGPIDSTYDMRPALFPLFPYLVRGVYKLTGNLILSGLLLSNTCLLVFLLCLYRLVRIDFDDGAAARAVWLYLLFPSSLFLSGIYAESLLLALSVGAALAARKGKFAVAGLLSGAALVTRPVGCLVCILVGIEWLAASGLRLNRKNLLQLAGIVLLPAGAAVAYYMFAQRTFVTPLEFMNIQQRYRGNMTWPWRSFTSFWQNGPVLHAYDNSIYDATLAGISLLLIPLIAWRSRISYAAFAAANILMALSTSLVSFNRIVVGAFPCFIIVAAVSRKWWMWVPIVLVCAAMLFLMTYRFTRWLWVA